MPTFENQSELMPPLDFQLATDWPGEQWRPCFNRMIPEHLVFPINCLQRHYFHELLKDAGEVYGFDQNGAVKLFCIVYHFLNVLQSIQKEKGYLLCRVSCLGESYKTRKFTEYMSCQICDISRVLKAKWQKLQTALQACLRYPLTWGLASNRGIDMAAINAGLVVGLGSAYKTSKSTMHVSKVTPQLYPFCSSKPWFFRASAVLLDIGKFLGDFLCFRVVKWTVIHCLRANQINLVA